MENIRQIVLRYELSHPVVVDEGMRVWESYAVRAWPTTVLVDPRGYVIASHSGEGVYDAYADTLAKTIARYEAEGLVDRTPLAMTLEQESVPQTPLSFPGKILADAENELL